VDARSSRGWKFVGPVSIAYRFYPQRSLGLATFLSGAPQRIVSDRLKIKSQKSAPLLQQFVDAHETNAHGGLISRPVATARNFRDSDDPLLEIPRPAQQARLFCHRRSNSPPIIVISNPGSARVEKFWNGNAGRR